MRTPPTSPVVATGLVGGFAIAGYSGRRELGGLPCRLRRLERAPLESGGRRGLADRA